jgi:hypothetical protein
MIERKWDIPNLSFEQLTGSSAAAADWNERHAPWPGDLIYLKDLDTGEVLTDRMWSVIENEGAVAAENLADTMPWATYWSVQVACDGQCDGVDSCTGEVGIHYFLLAAGDFVFAAEAP